MVMIIGPTAVGKTRLSLQLAHLYPGSEIISVDAYQVYQGLDIGTGKLTRTQQEGIPHHLIDIKRWDESYSVGEFLQQTDALIKTHPLPPNAKWILCGGTGFYLNAFLYKMEFNHASDLNIRETLQKRVQNEGAQVLWDELNAIDPDYAQKVSCNDAKRISRGLELYQLTQKRPSELEVKLPTQRDDVCLIGLEMERSKLYETIHQRIDDMLAKGWIDEVRQLMSAGFEANMPAAGAIGYPEIINYLKGDIPQSEMVNCIQMNTRRFAKRQLTWLRRFSNVNWLSA